MPSNEREEQNEPTERLPQPPYMRAAAFLGERPARRAYFAIERLIAQVEANISFYRFQLRRISHVAAVRFQPPEPLVNEMDAVLQTGRAVSLPGEVARSLLTRHNRPWVLASAGLRDTTLEGRYQMTFPDNVDVLLRLIERLLFVQPGKGEAEHVLRRLHRL